jgi:hypothetical protein
MTISSNKIKYLDFLKVRKNIEIIFENINTEFHNIMIYTSRIIDYNEIYNGKIFNNFNNIAEFIVQMSKNNYIESSDKKYLRSNVSKIVKNILNKKQIGGNIQLNPIYDFFEKLIFFKNNIDILSIKLDKQLDIINKFNNLNKISCNKKNNITESKNTYQKKINSTQSLFESTKISLFEFINQNINLLINKITLQIINKDIEIFSCIN